MVEDDPAIRRLLTRYLRDRHFRVEAVSDGLAALACLPTLQPHLIVTDLDLPHLGGYALLARLAEHPATRRIPVVVFSAQLDTADTATSLGCAAVLMKPAPPQELLKKIREVLRSRPDGLE